MKSGGEKAGASALGGLIERWARRLGGEAGKRARRLILKRRVLSAAKRALEARWKTGQAPGAVTARERDILRAGRRALPMALAASAMEIAQGRENPLKGLNGWGGFAERLGEARKGPGPLLGAALAGRQALLIWEGWPNPPAIFAEQASRLFLGPAGLSFEAWQSEAEELARWAQKEALNIEAQPAAKASLARGPQRL